MLFQQGDLQRDFVFVRNVSKATTAACRKYGTIGFHSFLRRFQNLRNNGKRMLASTLYDPCPHSFAGQGSMHKYGSSVVMGKAETVLHPFFT